jgi:putative ABC transport system permease protein
MWRAAYRNIVAHRLRLALTTLTVALGIAFVAGTNAVLPETGRRSVAGR